MSKIYLRTKLYQPRLRALLVTRSRLMKKLDQGINCEQAEFLRKLTLIAAPAGYGKTTLVTDWLKQTEENAPWQSGWLSLDTADNDPILFFTYLLAASAEAGEAVGESARELLQGNPSVPPETLVSLLINDFSLLPRPFLLILDDYHTIENQAVHQAIDHLLVHQPPQLHIIMTSRTSPPLNLPQLRVRDHLTEIEAADLRFTTAETAVFLQTTMGLTLSPENVAALEARTEGWIAAIQLAALTLQKEAEPSAVIAAFSGEQRHVFDYLINEVLRQQDEETRLFLRTTAVLDRFNADLCNSLLNRSDCQQILTQLEEENLFIVPLDDNRRWYRYHQLFAELLLSQLSTEEKRQVQLQAAIWHEDQGHITEALNYALAARDFEKAAPLFGEVFGEILQNGEIRTLSRWLSAFPEPFILAKYELAIGSAWVQFLQGQMAEAHRYLEAAIAQVPTKVPPSELISLQAFLANAAGDLGAAIEYAHIALDQSQLDDPLRSVMLLNMAQAQFAAGQTVQAAETSWQAVNESRQQGNDFSAISALNIHLQLLAMLGRRRELERVSTQTMAWYQTNDGQPGPLAYASYLGLAQAHYSVNGLPQAQELGQQALALSGQLGDRHGQMAGYMLLAQILQAQGEPESALQTMQQVATAVQEPMGQALARAMEINLRLRQGDLDTAVAWLQTSALSVEDTPHLLLEAQHLTLVRVLLAQNQSDEAMMLLPKLAHSAAMAERKASELTITILQAVAHDLLGQPSEAQAMIKKAVAIAEPEGLLRPFLDEPFTLNHLLAQLPQTKFVSDLLSALSPAAPAGLVEPLTEREQEILILISQGLSNPEIADRLIVSVGTVKTHSHNLYSKLGVRNRVEAIARAQELSLL